MQRISILSIFKFVLGGPLQEILTQDGFLPENTICQFGKDILLGINHLHDRGIVFADLCPKKVDSVLVSVYDMTVTKLVCFVVWKGDSNIFACVIGVIAYIISVVRKLK